MKTSYQDSRQLPKLGKVDLHTHSTASDGSLSPTELIILAREQDINRLALTDHDNIDGIAEAVLAGENYDVEVIPGIEFSVSYDSGDLHLLGYGFDVTNPELSGTISKLQNSRGIRNKKIVEKLNSLGYTISWKSIQEIAGDGVMGRGHISQALMNSGKFESVNDVFKQLLSSGAPAYVDRYRLKIGDAINLIHNAGGVAVWAHPGLHDDFESMLPHLPQWIDAGLDGLESDYSVHSMELRDRLRSIATAHGIIYTGGSDFHGSLKPDIQLGQGPDGQPVGEECYLNLRTKIEGMQIE